MTPRNFTWVLQGELAASARPAGFAELLRLREMGIGAVVTLTERALSKGELEECGLASLHLPVADFTAPTLEQIQALCDFFDEQRSLDRAVLVHCQSGYGRSGTMAACLLVRLERLDAVEAIERVRALRPGSIETVEQERIVQVWAEHLRTRLKEQE